MKTCLRRKVTAKKDLSYPSESCGILLVSLDTDNMEIPISVLRQRLKSTKFKCEVVRERVLEDSDSFELLSEFIFSSLLQLLVVLYLTIANTVLLQIHISITVKYNFNFSLFQLTILNCQIIFYLYVFFFT